MKRLHVHVAVENLDESIRFYATLFGAEPNVSEHDYAKWLLDDPAVNFAISDRSGRRGIDHLGIQVETADELADVTERLSTAQAQVLQEEAAQCCYAKGDKTWTADPQGVAWETFHTYGEIRVFGKDTGAVRRLQDAQPADGCCDGAPAER